VPVFFLSFIMIKNYFFLNRFILEAKEILNGYKITSAFTQEKDILIITLRKGAEEYFLAVSVNPGLPYLSLKEEFHRAKKNVVTFFEDKLPSNLVNFSIAEDDRIIKIDAEDFSLYFTIRGKFTNIYLINDDEIISFKKTEDDVKNNFIEEVSGKKFLSHFNIPLFEIDAEEDFYIQLKEKYPFVGKEIISEHKSRSEEEEKLTLLNTIINEINNEPPAIFIDEAEGNLNLAVSSFHIFPDREVKLFSALIEAYNFFISKYFSLSRSVSKRKIIEKHLERELAKISSRLNKLKGRIDKGSSDEEYNKAGNLLLINLHKIKSGMKEITVDDIYNDNIPLTLKIDPKLSPQLNSEKYFDKAKSERISYEQSYRLYHSLLNEYNRLLKIKSEFDESNEKEKLNIMKELKIKTNEPQNQKDDLKNKFRHYIVEDKYHLFVGKDNKSNDLLTTKFAKQNDYWFHAKSVSGSHVVLRVDNTKEAVSKNILKKAAAVAAFHSKAKTAGMVPVSYTFKKYVVKKKGMDAGKVALLKEEVLIVRPEIPDGVIYIPND
jgi:predicted ribosome quality control (RQC) complex YloA/Tae2 family protein